MFIQFPPERVEWGGEGAGGIKVTSVTSLCDVTVGLLIWLLCRGLRA